MRILFGGDHGQEGMKCDVVSLEHGIVQETSLYGTKHLIHFWGFTLQTSNPFCVPFL